MPNLFDKLVDKLNKKYPSGLAGYNAHYTLLHPWAYFPYWWQKIRFAWQRVTRGWDDTAVWSLDTYLARMISEVVPEIKKHKGIPAILMPIIEPYRDLTDEEYDNLSKQWCEILDNITEGFAQYNNEAHCFLDNPYPKFDKAMELLVKYYSNLWT